MYSYGMVGCIQLKSTVSQLQYCSTGIAFQNAILELQYWYRIPECDTSTAFQNAILEVVSLSLSVSQGVSTARYLQKGGIATAIPNTMAVPTKKIILAQFYVPGIGRQRTHLSCACFDSDKKIPSFLL